MVLTVRLDGVGWSNIDSQYARHTKDIIGLRKVFGDKWAGGDPKDAPFLWHLVIPMLMLIRNFSISSDKFIRNKICYTHCCISETIKRMAEAQFCDFSSLASQ